MSVRAAISSPAVGQLRDFLEGDAPGLGEAAASPSRTFRSPRESVNRFDVVEGGRRDAVAPGSAERASFAQTRPAAWAPERASGQTAAVEQYRRLAAALIQAQAEHGTRVVMVASSVGGEGKSLTVANLAVTLANSCQRQTLVVDADLRAPSQHAIFRVANSRGLSDWLRAPRAGALTTVQLASGLTLLTAGQPTADPMAGLTSSHMKALLADASAAFDFVLLDTPPIGLVPDATILAGVVDSVVLVIKAGSTPFAVVERSVAAIGRDRILGTVLNKSNSPSAVQYGYGYSGR